MRRILMFLAGALATTSVWGEDLSGTDEFLCSVSRVAMCFETGECFDIQPWEADIPQFVVVDTKKKVISTTHASERPRSTRIATLQRSGGQIFLQGLEADRAFSFVIDEATGFVTVAVSRDGLSVSVFGACTDANVRPAT
jgi:hypothetical protein